MQFITSYPRPLSTDNIICALLQGKRLQILSAKKKQGKDVHSLRIHHTGGCNPQDSDKDGAWNESLNCQKIDVGNGD